MVEFQAKLDLDVQNLTVISPNDGLHDDVIGMFTRLICAKFETTRARGCVEICKFRMHLSNKNFLDVDSRLETYQTCCSLRPASRQYAVFELRTNMLCFSPSGSKTAHFRFFWSKFRHLVYVRRRAKLDLGADFLEMVTMHHESPVYVCASVKWPNSKKYKTRVSKSAARIANF